MTPRKLHPAILGGLFIGVVSALPLVGAVNSCCCLWLTVGGMLAAYVMQQNHPAPVSLVDGAGVGFLAGAIGVVVMALASAIIAFVHVGAGGFGGGISISDPNMSPEVSEMLRRMDPKVLTIVGGVIFVCVGVAASTVGGTIGAALFRRTAPPSSGGLPPAGQQPGFSPAGLPPGLPPGWGPPPSSWTPPADLPPAPPAAPDALIDPPGPGRPSHDRPGPDDPPS